MTADEAKRFREWMAQPAQVERARERTRRHLARQAERDARHAAYREISARLFGTTIAMAVLHTDGHWYHERWRMLRPDPLECVPVFGPWQPWPGAT